MVSFREIKERLESLGPKDMTLSEEEVGELDREIDELAASIAQEASAETADARLQQLGEIVDVLTIICFDTKLPFSKKQRWLVRNYERWEESSVRAQCFGWIKAGKIP